MKQKQLEICPWCQKKIYAAPGNAQPCPKCRQLINVYLDDSLINDRDMFKDLELVLERAKDELMELQMAMAKNFKVAPWALKSSQMRVYRLKEKLNKFKR